MFAEKEAFKRKETMKAKKLAKLRKNYELENSGHLLPRTLANKPKSIMEWQMPPSSGLNMLSTF